MAKLLINNPLAYCFRCEFKWPLRAILSEETKKWDFTLPGSCPQCSSRTWNKEKARAKKKPSNYCVRSLTITEIKKHKSDLYLLQKGICAGCKEWKNYECMEIDHITPRSKGGDNSPDNFQLLCGPCNRKKKDMPVADFLAIINKK